MAELRRSPRLVNKTAPTYNGTIKTGEDTVRIKTAAVKAAAPVPEKTVDGMTGKQILLFSALFVGYAFYTLLRKSFSVAMPGLIEDFKFTKVT